MLATMGSCFGRIPGAVAFGGTRTFSSRPAAIGATNLASLARRSCVRMLTFLGGMLHAEDHDLIGGLIDRVVDKIPKSSRHNLAHALDLLGSAYMWE